MYFRDNDTVLNHTTLRKGVCICSMHTNNVK